MRWRSFLDFRVNYCTRVQSVWKTFFFFFFARFPFNFEFPWIFVDTRKKDDNWKPIRKDGKYWSKYRTITKNFESIRNRVTNETGSSHGQVRKTLLWTTFDLTDRPFSFDRHSCKTTLVRENNEAVKKNLEKSRRIFYSYPYIEMNYWWVISLVCTLIPRRILYIYIYIHK